MKNLLWPSKANPNPGVLTRFGRLIHWIAAALSGTIAILALLLVVTSDDDQRFVGLAILSFWAAIIYVVGRGSRYVLSAE